MSTLFDARRSTPLATKRLTIPVRFQWTRSRARSEMKGETC